MRKLIISITILALLAAPYTVLANEADQIINDYLSSGTAPTSFSDVSQVDWAEEAILFLSSCKVVQGAPDGLFWPNKTVSKIEFSKILISALGLYDPEAEIFLEDTQPGAWQNAYAAIALSLGITQCAEQGVFGVDMPLTREKMFLMTYKALKFKNELSINTQPLAFADSSDIDDACRTAIDYFSATGIIKGTPQGYAEPKRESTRAECSVIIYNILKMLLEGHI